MRRIRLTILALLSVAALASVSGCHFYFGGDDDDDDDCLWGADTNPVDEDYADPYPDIRNPESGMCESWGSGGGGGGNPCADPCDPYCGGDVPTTEPDRPSPAAEPMPSWGMCDGYCETLGENDCLNATGCRGAYLDVCGVLPCAIPPTFYQCWATDQSGPIQGGDCSGLDAYSCSLHDDCIAIHESACNGGTDSGDEAPPDGLVECEGIGNFAACANERAGCYSDYDCADGTTCNADELCLPSPDCGGSGGGSYEEPQPADCEAACYGYCVPEQVDPGQCTGPVYCDMVPPPCPLGGVPGIANGCYTGQCIANSDCPSDPGECNGPVYCDMVEPACPPDTVPGIADGCWTGQCIPLSECPDNPISCDIISSEAMCVARPDCAPYYEGINCNCDDPDTSPGDAPSECTCEDWLFVACQ